MKIEEIKKIASENGNFRALSAEQKEAEGSESLTVEGVAIIANYIDSHGSIFTEDCLRASLDETIIHSADHIRDYDHLISTSVEKEIRSIPFRDLGVDIEGDAIAFCFKSVFEKEDNERMYKQYKRGRVKYHSIEFDWSRRGAEIYCANHTIHGQEYKDNWDKYYPTVMNKDVADSRGWFYVYEKAPIVAVSAVVLGSNKVTPTLSARGLSDEVLKLEIEPKEDSKREEKQSIISRLSK